MTRDELEKRNVGENLDALMNLDPRGYGVCRILYAGSRAFTGEPLTMHAAQVLCDSIKENDLVYILVGFVLLPHKVPEMDGTVSAMLLARALVMAFNAKPIIVCPADSVQAIEKCAAVVGLHIYEDLDTVQELPLSMGVVAFTKDKAAAPAQAEALAARKPAAVISVEASGANALGVYHNAVGKDVTEMQAKSERSGTCCARRACRISPSAIWATRSAWGRLRPISANMCRLPMRGNVNAAAAAVS